MAVQTEVGVELEQLLLQGAHRTRAARLGLRQVHVEVALELREESKSKAVFKEAACPRKAI